MSKMQCPKGPKEHSPALGFNPGKHPARRFALKLKGREITIRETITAAIDPIFPTSGQGDMTVLWPEAVVKESTPFRYGAPGVRDFWNIPDVELIGLARELSEQGITSGQIILQMIKDIGIARVTEGIRGRLDGIVGRCGGGPA